MIGPDLHVLVLRQMNSVAVVRRPSLSEFADQFEKAIKEKQDLTRRLQSALEEIAKLNSNVADLECQLAASKRSASSAADARLESLLAARERLIRDEFERKFQDLSLEVKRQRKKYAHQIAEMKQQMSNCICRASGLE
jgi:hypothetical protein